MKGILITVALLSLVIAGTASAGQVTTFVVTNPAYTDGTAIDGPATNVISCGTVTGGPYTIVSPSTASLTTSIATVLGAKADGIYFCICNVWDVWQTKSPNSNQVILSKNGTSFFAPSGMALGIPGIVVR
jgi:hypothetical protein